MNNYSKEDLKWSKYLWKLEKSASRNSDIEDWDKLINILDPLITKNKILYKEFYEDFISVLEQIEDKNLSRDVIVSQVTKTLIEKYQNYAERRNEI